MPEFTVPRQLMPISKAARDYAATKKTAKTIIYSADRFVRLCGDMLVDEISADKVMEYREKCAAAGYSAWTIKSSSKDIVTLLHNAGKSLKLDPVKVPRPKPVPTPIEHIDAIFQFLPDYARQFVVLAYWTGLRLEDVIRLQHSDFEGHRLEWQANKTGHWQQWPVPEWCRHWLVRMKLPYTANMDWSERIIRGDLEAAAIAANVPRVKPSEIRDRSITEWTRCDPTVGKIVHGSGLGVLSHYVDTLAVISGVMHRMKLPKCFGATESREDEIVGIVKLLDPEAQVIVRDMASRMVR